MACDNRYRKRKMVGGSYERKSKVKRSNNKKDNFVNDDKLARELIEAQEKWELDYKAGISCAKKKVLLKVMLPDLLKESQKKKEFIKEFT